MTEEIKNETQRITFTEFCAEGERRFGKDKKQWKFVCVSCGHIQCIQDFIDLEVKDPQDKMFFSCIGRWMKNSDGSIFNGKSPCNYTLGGLLNFSNLIIIDDEGGEHPSFEFAPIEESKTDAQSST